MGVQATRGLAGPDRTAADRTSSMEKLQVEDGSENCRDKEINNIRFHVCFNAVSNYSHVESTPQNP